MKDLTDKNKWSLKDLKTLSRLSDRSHRLSVELLYDGRKVGYATNTGGGAPTDVTVKAPEAKLPAQADLVQLVDDLIDQELALRDLTRKHKGWMALIASGREFALALDDLRDWEAGAGHPDSPQPPFRVFGGRGAAAKALAGVKSHIYTDVSSAELWEMMVKCDQLWRAKLKAAKRGTTQADATPPRDPFLGSHYIRNPQHAEEVRKLEIGRTLEMSLYGDLPLTATARLEAMKLLGGAGMLVDDEIPTRELFDLYVQYVVPHQPRTLTDMVDD